MEAARRCDGADHHRPACEALPEEVSHGVSDLHKRLQFSEEVSQTKDDYDRILVKMDHMKLNQDEKESVICELQETFYGLAAENESAKAALAKAQQELEALRIREKEKDRKLTVLAEEMEKKCCELENKSAEGNDIKAAMEAMQKELLALKKESANHKEIIRILQEENAEAGRNLTEARKGVGLDASGEFNAS